MNRRIHRILSFLPASISFHSPSPRLCLSGTLWLFDESDNDVAELWQVLSTCSPRAALSLRVSLFFETLLPERDISCAGLTLRVDNFA